MPWGHLLGDGLITGFLGGTVTGGSMKPALLLPTRTPQIFPLPFGSSFR